MSVNITIPLDALHDASVARAMTDLILALGRIRAAGASYPAAAPAIPTAKTGETAPSALPRRGRGRPRKVKPAEPVEPAEPEGGGSLQERFTQFFDGLPDRSREFLELVRQKKVVTMSDAMKEMGVTVPKTMGGITGSIGRWAPRRGLPIPYEASTNASGERIWTWTLPDLGQPVKRKRGRPPKAKTPAELAEAAAPKPRGRRRAKKETPQEEATTEPISLDLSELRAEGAQELFQDERYKNFLDDMRDLSRRFLILLSKQGEITMTQALSEFGLTRANAMGGVIGPLKRRAQDFGLSIPFEVSTTPDGERVWRWRNPLRKVTPEPAPADDVQSEADRLAFSGVRRRRKGAKEATPL